MLNSLKLKIASTIFILVAIMLSIVIWQTLSLAFQQNKQNINTVKNTSLNLLEQTARTALFSEEYDTIQFRIEGIIDNPHIKHIFLSDSRNIIVASDQFQQLGGTAPIIQDPQKNNWEIKNISNITGNLGTLYVQYSFTDINQENRYILYKGLSIAVLGTFIIAIVSLLLAQLLTRRLDILSQAAENISKGKLHSRTKLKGKDEISKLGHTFDNMADYIEQEQATLAELNQSLEQRVAERTRDYENTNKELEAFCHAVSHDLRAPLRSINGYSTALVEDCEDSLDSTAKSHLARIKKNTEHMSLLIENLLKLSRINQQDIHLSRINISSECRKVLSQIQEQQSYRRIEIIIADNIEVSADHNLLPIMLENLLSNAYKYTQKVDGIARIEFGCEIQKGRRVYYVKDNGAGFDMRYADKLFATFQRLHSDTEFEGTGVGLSTVQRIVHRHGGEIWAESVINKGSCFYFTLGEEKRSAHINTTAA